MEPARRMRVSLDRAAGVAVLEKGGWRHVVPLADLPRWRDLARGLWARGGKKGGPGPQAKFYEADVAALERALAELERGAP